MTEQTLIAVYDTAAHADAAVRDLEGAGVPASSISRHAKEGMVTSSTRATGAAPVQKEGFWASLFGDSDEYAPDQYETVYDRSIAGGSTVVTVRISDQQFDRISAILERHNPIDLDERASQYGVSQTAGMGATGRPAAGLGAAGATGKGETLQLSEESLAVGKRAVSGGTTRVRRYVVETPVEQQVNLRSERVMVDRHPVADGRSVSPSAFTDNEKVIEMTETREEPVVSKTARVKEEVTLRKEATDRVETIRDTVRREDVKVDRADVREPGTQRPGQTR